MEPISQATTGPAPTGGGRSRRDLLVDHLADLLGTARVYVPDRRRAERLVQDLIREVLDDDAPDSKRPARVWLQRRLYALARTAPVTPPAGSTGDPTDVRAALRRLPLPERAAVHLVDATACSYVEVADVLGTDVTTAAQLLHRGRRTLAGLLSFGPSVA